MSKALDTVWNMVDKFTEKPKYVFIEEKTIGKAASVIKENLKPFWTGSEIEADSAEEARELFAEMLRENTEAEHIEANNIDDDGEDD